MTVSGDQAGTPEVVDTDEVLEFEDAPEAGTSGAALAVNGKQEVSLFGAGGPAVALERVEEYANHLKAFVKDHDLTLEMEDGSDYLLTPAWEALGQMMGIYATVEFTEPYQNGWKAKAVAHRQGERLTAREGICLRSEPGKQYKPETDIHAMAQTRACRNALKACLNIIVNAAGYDGAPAEERAMTPKQRANIFALLARLDKYQPKGKNGWKDWLTDATLKRFGQRISGLNRLQGGQVIEGLKKMVDELEAAENPKDWEPDEATIRDAEAIEF